MVLINKVSKSVPTNNPGSTTVEVSSSNHVRDPSDRTSTNKPKVWKNVLTVVLVVVIVAAIIIAGKIFWPKLVEFAGSAGKVISTGVTVASAAAGAVTDVGEAIADATTHTGQTIKKGIQLFDKLLNEPIIVTAVQGVSQFIVGNYIEDKPFTYEGVKNFNKVRQFFKNWFGGK